jgi:hypothetical protein
VVAATTCARDRPDPPTPTPSFEIASAAPGALGPLAGGTDAAPPVVAVGPSSPGEPADPEELEEELPDGGGPIDAGGSFEPETIPL